MAQIKITLTRSLIGYPQDQRMTVKALGLGKITYIKEDTRLLGAIHKVRHLVKVEEA